jgi:DNA polymerase IV
MDAFFASVEQLDNPALRGRPVLVGHDGPRGVVAAASYEARSFGCHSAQPMAMARQRCPQAVVVPVRGGRYREVSGRMFSILEQASPLVEPLSIDEAFVDLTGTQRLLGPAPVVAERLRRRIRDELGLPASVGVAGNKFLAKLASDLAKPDGLMAIDPQGVDRVLIPLPVSRLWGVGPVTAERLHALGVRTIGDFRRADPDRLRGVCGEDTQRLIQLARGLDDRPVVCADEARSISHEQTFELDQSDPDHVRRVLFAQVERVGRRLRKADLKARTVTLKIRLGDFQTITRSATLPEATNTTDELWRAAKGIFDRWVSASFQPVRLIGMAANQLGHGQSQLPLFQEPGRLRQQQLDQMADRIAGRFGAGAIRRGGGL